MTDWTHAIIAVVVAIISLATLSVILSKQAATKDVISASATGLSQLIGQAVSPITGQSYSGLSTSFAALR